MGEATAPRRGVAASQSATGRRLLAVFAHPDDEALCAGGTLALCADAGQQVTVICATRGEFGPVSDPALVHGSTLAAVREHELRASCAVLGVRDVRVMGLPDAGVQWAAEEVDALGSLEDAIRSLRPHAIITFGPDGLYGHPDHVAISELVTEARRRVEESRACLAASGDASAAECPTPRLFYPVMTADDVRQLLADMTRAGLGARLWSLQPDAFVAKAEEVTASVDVSSVLQRKLAALRAHRTQLDADNPFTEIPDDIAMRFFGLERYRCADGLGGDPTVSPPRSFS